MFVPSVGIRPIPVIRRDRQNRPRAAARSPNQNRPGSSHSSTGYQFAPPLNMNQDTFVSAAYQLVLTTADIGGKVMGWEEQPADKVSKYSWYMVTLKDTGWRAQVVRNAVVGWGPKQEDALATAVGDGASSGETLTAYISSYGDTTAPSIRVEAKYQKSKLSIEFPYRPVENGVEFTPSLEASKEDVARVVTEWAGQAVRKKFLGLF